VNALLHALSDLASDAGVRSVLGAEARKRCVEIYNWDLVTDQIEAVYYRVLGGGDFASRRV
jgi:glycosyltransferase involved in cell wall biosynthesis